MKRKKHAKRNLKRCKVDVKPRKIWTRWGATRLARLSNDPIYKLVARELVAHGHINFWKHGAYGQGVRVAIMDTGIYLNSPAFKDATNITGKSFVEGQDWDKDGHGHGTFVASQIYHKFDLAEVIRHKEIICCGCPKIESLLILKNLPDRGSGPITNTLKALDYLLELPEEELPHILNCSFSSPPDTWKTDIGIEIAEKVLALQERGVLIFCAAGNSGHKEDPRVRFFANLTPTYAIASTGGYSGKSYFSSYGQHISYASDGELRLGIRNKDDLEYGKSSGTSMSCPDGAAFAALTLSHLTKNSRAIRQLIKDKKAEEFWQQKGMLHDAGDPGFDHFFGNGVFWFKDTISLK